MKICLASNQSLFRAGFFVLKFGIWLGRIAWFGPVLIIHFGKPMKIIEEKKRSCGLCTKA